MDEENRGATVASLQGAVEADSTIVEDGGAADNGDGADVVGPFGSAEGGTAATLRGSGEQERAPVPDYVRGLLGLVNKKLEEQRQRIDRVERESQNVAGTLLSQVAELETRYQEADAAVEARVMQSVDALIARIETAENARLEAEQRALDAEAGALREKAREDIYREAWRSAPLTLRLKFVRELVPDSHSLQDVLKEADALETLRLRGRDLETWLTNYPALFADAVQALVSGVREKTHTLDVLVAHPAYLLAAKTLQDVETTLETTLQALGVTWIEPSPGDPITPEHEVIGEEPSFQNEGAVACLRRRGFRFHGRLALPAQVSRALASRPEETTRSAPQEAAGSCAAQRLGGEGASAQPAMETITADLPTATPEETTGGTGTEATDAGMPQGNTGSTPGGDLQGGAGSNRQVQERENAVNDIPGWRRILGQRTFGCDLPEVLSLVDHVNALNDLPGRISQETSEEASCRIVLEALAPLLPMLGLRYADGLPGVPEAWGVVFLEVREPLLAWLAESLDVLPLAPVRGNAFDPRTMEATETRRTVHASEDETVAKLERIGVSRHGRPLIRAQVVRYAAGGST